MIIYNYQTKECLWESKKSTRKLAVVEAVRNNADLSYASLQNIDLHRANLFKVNLRRADLCWINLSGTNLRRANLSGAYLIGANLSGADLSGADLREANLYGANLRVANLSGANLYEAIGNNREIKTIHSGEYVINIHKDDMYIGCKHYTIEQWWRFTDDEINAMDHRALGWWRTWKPILQQITKT